MAPIDYNERIPNNVSLTEDRRLLRALEDWQPKFLDWWKEMGPAMAQDKDAYLRTAVGQADKKNFLAALKVARALGPGHRVAAISPDSGARYLSTSLYAGGADAARPRLTE